MIILLVEGVASSSLVFVLCNLLLFLDDLPGNSHDVLPHSLDYEDGRGALGLGIDLIVV